MKTMKTALGLGCLLLGTVVVHGWHQSGDHPPDHQIMTATRCDTFIPLRVGISELGRPETGGRAASFRLHVESRLDPDRIADLHVEYELPRGVRMSAPPAALTREKSSQDVEFGVTVPGTARYPIRARVVARLADGTTLALVAQHVMGPAEEDRADGMVDRIVEPDGTAIRVFRSSTARGEE